MADSSDKVLALVEAELKKNPGATTEELQTAAKKKYPSAGKLSKRQFNARYALQIKRRKPKAAAKAATGSPAKRRVRRAAKTEDTPKTPRRPRVRRAAAAAASASPFDRDAVRGQFLRFASDITAAESRRDLVRVLANVDKYVDAVQKASS